MENSLLETNRVLVSGLQDIKSLQVDHRELQQRNLEALNKQIEHNVLLERILKEADQQDKINDDIFTQLRELARGKVEAVDFRLTLDEMKKESKDSLEVIRSESKNNIDLLRTDGKWFIGISLTAVTVVLSLVVILMNIMDK